MNSVIEALLENLLCAYAAQSAGSTSISYENFNVFIIQMFLLGSLMSRSAYISNSEWVLTTYIRRINNLLNEDWETSTFIIIVGVAK